MGGLVRPIKKPSTTPKAIGGHEPKNILGVEAVNGRRIGNLEGAPRSLSCERPCCLCGRVVAHGALTGENAREILRASFEDGVIWVPKKPHGPQQGCPDPPAKTKLFWPDNALREEWKRRHRARMMMNRGERS